MSRSPEAIGHHFLRVGVGFAFLYPPIDAFSNPDSWVGYFPNFITALPIDPLVLLHSFGVLEIILAVWIFSGWKVRVPAIVAALLLIAIVVCNGAQFPVLFRDVSIAMAALALAFIPHPKRCETCPS